MDNKRKPGRPYAKDQTKPISIRMTKRQHEIYMENGGARWLKALLERMGL